MFCQDFFSFLFYIIGPFLSIYNDFLLCVLMGLLCANMCVSVSICVSHVFYSGNFFLNLCFLVSSYCGLFLFYFILLLLDACLFYEERQKGCLFG